jgi:hypothetical protein
MRAYPAGLPCPQVEDYSYIVKSGVIRFDDNVGIDQRRDYETMPHLITATFVLSTTIWDSWQVWMDTFGRSWFTMPMVSMYSSRLDPTKVAPDHVVRCVSETFDAKYLTDKNFKVKAQFELAPSMFLFQLGAA